MGFNQFTSTGSRKKFVAHFAQFIMSTEFCFRLRRLVHSYKWFFVFVWRKRVLKWVQKCKNVRLLLGRACKNTNIMVHRVVSATFKVSNKPNPLTSEFKKYWDLTVLHSFYITMCVCMYVCVRAFDVFFGWVITSFTFLFVFFRLESNSRDL